MNRGIPCCAGPTLVSRFGLEEVPNGLRSLEMEDSHMDLDCFLKGWMKTRAQKRRISRRGRPQGTFPFSFGNFSVTLQLIEPWESEEIWNLQNAVWGRKCGWYDGSKVLNMESKLMVQYLILRFQGVHDNVFAKPRDKLVKCIIHIRFSSFTNEMFDEVKGHRQWLKMTNILPVLKLGGVMTLIKRHWKWQSSFLS